MPTYTYACTECDEQIEVVQSFSSEPLTECPRCSGRLRKVFHPVGVVFKGSGFYRTDSRSSTASRSTSGASTTGSSTKEPSPAASGGSPAAASSESSSSTSAGSSGSGSGSASGGGTATSAPTGSS